MRSNLLFWSLCFLVGLLSVRSIASADDTPKLFDYRDIRLDNGLRVISLEDFSSPLVAVQVWYHVGSKDENPERQGFAHMFEHMMFQGTDTLGPTGHFDFIHKVGGDCNAYTSWDNTTYVQTVPSQQLALALHLEAERMSFLRIDQKSFDTERKVVEEERRLGLNGPYGTAAETLVAKFFTTHPYKWLPIGKIPHLRAASVQDLRDFWTTFYVPNNATLVVVGAVKHEDVQRLAKEKFGWIPKGNDPPRVAVREPLPEKPRKFTLKERNAPTPITGFLYHGVPVGHKDTAALTMAMTILGGNESSRLYRALVADTQQAVVAIAAPFSLEHHGLVAAGAVLPPLGGSVKKVQKTIETEIERLRTEPVTDEELETARNAMLRDVVAQRLTVESKAGVIGQAAVLANDIDLVNRQIDDIRAVTKDDIARVAKQYLDPQRVARVTVERNLLGTVMGGTNAEENSPITAKPEEAAPPGRPGVKRPDGYPTEPPVAAPAPFKASADFQSATLENGLRIIVVENRELPWVTVTLGLEAGAWTDTAPGVASMAAQMLTKGTQNFDEKALTRALDREAISLGGNAGADSSSVSASSVSDRVGRAVEFLAEVSLRPTFPPKEFEKLRKQARTGMVISEQQPEYAAEREMRRRLFGDHPYSRTPAGEVADLDKLQPSDVSSWWNTFARPDMAALVFAGDISLDDAMVLAKRNFGGWKATGPKPAPAVAAAPAPSTTRIILVDRPGSVQSQIRAGVVGMDARDPRAPIASVVSSYFGGAFGARLNEEIRVKRGLTYGAGGGFSLSKLGGSFKVSTFSKTETTAAAVEAVIGEIKRLRDQPPTETELTTTKTHFLGGFASSRETPQAVAGEVWSLMVEGLPANYYDGFVKQFSEVSAEQCSSLANQTVDPAHLMIVVVGDAQRLKAELEKLAPVEVVAAAAQAETTPSDEDDADESDAKPAEIPAPASTK